MVGPPVLKHANFDTDVGAVTKLVIWHFAASEPFGEVDKEWIYAGRRGTEAV